jgi:hypothetical protein
MTVAGSEPEAELLCSLLRSADIGALPARPFAGRAGDGLGPAGPHEILVGLRDAQDARDILHRPHNQARQTREAAVWKSPTMTAEPESGTPSELIDAKIEELADWRGETLSRIRGLIRQAVPEVVEEIKWRKPSNPFGVPVWSHDGVILTGEIYKDKVKLTFFQGASLEDPADLFNSSLEGKTRRAIDLHQGDDVDEEAFNALVRSAAQLNAS